MIILFCMLLCIIYIYVFQTSSSMYGNLGISFSLGSIFYTLLIQLLALQQYFYTSPLRHFANIYAIELYDKC